ncbi:MAG TPA: LamG-like jellyroll fold domain-containing protein, partial [Isosphaeraceae bacterium]
ERTQLVERSMAFELDPQARRIVADGARPDGFVSAPELSVPPLDLGPAYAAAVLRSRPRGYWRFESLAGRAVPNEVPGGEQLRLNGPVGVAGASTGNGCALFHAGEPEQFLFSDGLWEMTREPGHAVEFWFASEGISHASLVGLFPPKDYLTRDQNGRHIHTFLVELTAHDRGSLFKPASIRFLHRWPLDTRIGNNAVSEGLYVPRRWHHVVAQKNGGRMELFHDGALDRTMSLGPDHPTLSCRLVVGRRTPDPLDAHDARPFVGRLDELAIYDHPLSADEVLAHFRVANAGPPSE